MKHIAWLTDIHLDFLDAHEIHTFCSSVAHSGADAVLLGGDISNAPGIREHLLLLELLLTHVPPFKASCWHEGQISDDEFLPHFACRAVGDVLVEAMQKHPKCDLTVLCGHTHSPGEATILPNLLVKTGGAEYGSPCIQELIAID